VKHGSAQAINIASNVFGYTLNLLGRYVVGRAPNFLRNLTRIETGRQSEVHDLCNSVFREEEIPRFYIPMQEPGCMSRLQAGRHIAHGLKGVKLRQEPTESLRARFQTAALNHLHGDKISFVRHPARIDPDDIRVMQSCCELCLFLELFAESRVVNAVGPQDLNRHNSLERGVPRPEN
jgi:hypothetical protein